MKRLLFILSMLFFLVPNFAESAYLGSWKIDDTLTVIINTHIASTGAATDSTGSPTYRIYEDETGTAILNGSFAKLDDANTTGFYSEQVTLSAGNGFEKGKSYSLYAEAAVGSQTGTTGFTFQIEAEVDANTVSPTVTFDNTTIATVDNPVLISDGTGANQIALTSGVIDQVTLVVTTTTNTDMRGTDNGFTAANGTILDDRVQSAMGATFAESTDSLESIRDRGDAAWVTGAGGGITDILNIQPLIPYVAADIANTSTWRVGLMLINSLDDLPSTAEITPGTIHIDRKAIGATAWTEVYSGAMSESAGMIYSDVTFNSGSGFAEGDSLRYTLKNQKITVAANDYEISDATGRYFYGEIRQTMRGTDGAATAAALVTHNNFLGTVENHIIGTGNADWVTADVSGLATSAALAVVDGLIDSIKAVTDNLPDSGSLNDLNTLVTRLTAARAGYLDELESSNIPSDIDALNTKLTSTRAGYLDNLSAGAAALEATLTAMKGGGWSAETLVTIEAAIAALENLSAPEVWAYKISDDEIYTHSGGKLNAINPN